MTPEKALRVINESAKMMATALMPALEAASRAMKAFGDTYYHLAEKTYRKEMGRLPGGKRKRRLIKKRKAIVLKWFGEKLLECRSGREKVGDTWNNG